MPKLSSADTPPEKSRDCLPVSTIALSGVITRMPLVCMSMVASAFQYGCAPTLMPATTTLISPPAWVKVTIRRSARATQSMFSVPEFIAIRAPADSANHSTGTGNRSARSSAAMIRAHSGSDTAPSARVGSPSSTTRVIPSGCSSVGVLATPTTMPALLPPGARSTGTSSPVSARSCSTKLPAPPGDHRREFVGVNVAPATGPLHLLVVVVQRLQPLLGRAGHGEHHPGARAGRRSARRPRAPCRPEPGSAPRPARSRCRRRPSAGRSCFATRSIRPAARRSPARSAAKRRSCPAANRHGRPGPDGSPHRRRPPRVRPAASTRPGRRRRVPATVPGSGPARPAAGRPRCPERPPGTAARRPALPTG